MRQRGGEVDALGMVILLSDPRVHAVPVVDRGEPLVRLDATLGRDAWVRRSVQARLAMAAERLPRGYRLRVAEGHRSPAAQQAIIDRYSAAVAAANPGLGTAHLARLTSRFVAPLPVAPHVAGAAVDLTLADADGKDLDLGTPIDATPEASDGRCFTDSADISVSARRHRRILGEGLRAAGFVNYPTEWWHWSYGDRYWAFLTGAPAADYGPADLPEPAP